MFCFVSTHRTRIIGIPFGITKLEAIFRNRLPNNDKDHSKLSKIETLIYFEPIITLVMIVIFN